MKQEESIEMSRRHFTIAGLLAGAIMLAAPALFAQGVAFGSINPGLTDPPTTKPGTNTSFASLKRIDAGLLSVGYAEDGPADGPAVILLHGWPYDIYSYVDVAPLLAAKGYRVIIPYVRGYGSTRFLSDSNHPEWAAIGSSPRHHQSDGCS